MPGYVIHLAVGKKQIELNKIKNKEEFINGIIAPDLLKQKGIDSHYGDSSNPNLKEFLNTRDMQSDYNKGYFVHLATDFLFYNKFLEKWSPNIYEDYNILNKRLVEKYQIDIPEQVKKYVKFKEGDLLTLDFNDIIDFIDATGRLSFEEFLEKYIGESKDER